MVHSVACLIRFSLLPVWGNQILLSNFNREAGKIGKSGKNDFLGETVQKQYAPTGDCQTLQ